MTDRQLLDDLLEAGEDYVRQVVRHVLLQAAPAMAPIADQKAKRDYARAQLLDAIEAVVEAKKPEHLRRQP